MKRQTNFELLRVLTMAMIIAMHYMLKGNIAQPMSEDGSFVNHAAWLVEAFCIVAANCYVLISGYFLIKAEWKLKKLVRLALQILFYSLLIPIICLGIGIGDVSSWSVYEWIFTILPLQMEHYWFATSYVLLFMLIPVLAPGVRQLSQKQLQVTIGILLFYYCVVKSISPIHLSTDHYGYDLGWFLCLFMVSAYIRLYGISFLEKKGTAVFVYILSCLGIFAVSSVSGYICRQTGKLEYYMDMPYSYNYILTLLSAVALFYTFKKIKIRESAAARVICYLASCTFGIYLLHENMAVRNLWPFWFGAEKYGKSLSFIPHMIFAVFMVFAAGVLVESLRKKAEGVVMRLLASKNRIISDK